MEPIVPIGLIQMACSENAEENLRKAEGLIREAAGRGARIVCTQELFKTPYFCQSADPALFALAETLDKENPTLRRLSRLAAELSVVIIASLYEKRAPGLYHNTSVVLDADGTLLGKYRKTHIPDFPHYLEKFYFTPGDLGYHAFRTRYATVGVLICWDQWFPEAARLTAMRGADIIFYPTAIGYGPGEKEIFGDALHDSWEIVQRGHAVANACFVAAVDRVGFEKQPEGKGGIDFWGRSFVANPLGSVIGEASGHSDEALVCPIDLGLIAETRDSLSTFFRDRRPETYGGIAQQFLDEG
jgi:N-carbamoylputrescine amidase